jgi:hypothetical protein
MTPVDNKHLLLSAAKSPTNRFDTPLHLSKTAISLFARKLSAWNYKGWFQQHVTHSFLAVQEMAFSFFCL